jgi:hypothetical protein
MNVSVLRRNKLLLSLCQFCPQWTSESWNQYQLKSFAMVFGTIYEARLHSCHTISMSCRCAKSTLHMDQHLDCTNTFSTVWRHAILVAYICHEGN